MNNTKDQLYYAARGMTLLELVVVIALLSIVALSATTLIFDTGELKRQLATENQWLIAQRGIIHSDTIDSKGSKQYGGFAVDMGRLPRCLRELVRPLGCENDLENANFLPQYERDIDSKVWAGWRGPYISLAGSKQFRDGWNNQGRDDDTANDDDVNYGWLFGTGATSGAECADAVVAQKTPGAIVLQSCGDDEKVTPTDAEFIGDYPYVEDFGGELQYVPLVTRHDVQVELGSAWNEIPVEIRTANNDDNSYVIPQGELLVRMNYPISGAIVSHATVKATTDIDAAPFVSAPFPAIKRRLPNGAGKVFTGDDTDGDFLTDGAEEHVTFSPPAQYISSTGDTSLVRMANPISSAIIFTADGSKLVLHDCPCDVIISPKFDNVPVSGVVPDTSGKASPTLDLYTSPTTKKPDSLQVDVSKVAPMTADLGKSWIEVPQASQVNNASVVLPNGINLSFSATALDHVNYLPKIILEEGVTVTVGGTAEIEGDLVSIDTGSETDQFLVPSGSLDNVTPNVIELEKSAPTVPVGTHNLTVICNDANGNLFDGSCDRSKPLIASPHQFTVNPRTYVPAPNPIEWNIN